MQKGTLIKTSLFPRKIFLLSPGEEVNGPVSGHSCRLICTTDFHTARQFLLFSVPDALGVASRLGYVTFKAPCRRKRNNMYPGSLCRRGRRLPGVRLGGRGWCSLSAR